MSDKKIIMPLEEIMGERFGRYSKYIIQDRALPDVRDGLKPVQRRILYAMYKEGNVHAKPYRKCAKTVGVVIGNYHPHGDTSVYDAMVRLSQDWKMRVPLIDIQGNNGSIDNDPAAAMRYTEARLSKIAVELLRDLDKETCSMALNFDDTEYEPTVLPAKFPNLLINGATGISAGYATDIPPHNFQEVIDATIHRINHPYATLEDLMQFVKGPDFPTGAIVEGKEGIKEALRCGKGKVIVRAKTEIVEAKNMNQIVISEIPYEVNKAELVRKMDEIRFNRSIDGIIEVRDESDRNGLRIVVDLKKEVQTENILNYFFKNTDLQKNYNYNMVAICDKRPEQLGLIEILDAYIAHQIEVVTKRSLYELDKTEARLHIVDGLIKAISILDEVVAVIRKSKDKQDAKINLQKLFNFTEKQAEAIVMLQLYRLTNTDIVSLEEEKASLELYRQELNQILDDDKVLRDVIIKELKEVKSLYPSPRLTEIKDEVTEVTVDKEAMIISEDVVVSITEDGYVKRISLRSYKASDKTTFGKKEGDHLQAILQVNTLDKILLFTDKGNYLYLPVNELEEFRWRDLGKHISYLVKLSSDEKIIQSIVVRQFRDDLCIVLASQKGQVKRTSLKDFEVTRYSKAMKCFNLKDDDVVVSCQLSYLDQALLFISQEGYANFYNADYISIQGLKASGVKGIALKGEDRLVSMLALASVTKKALVLVSTKGYLKQLKIADIPVTNRAVKGIMMFKQTKSNPQSIYGAYVLDKEDELELVVDENTSRIVSSRELNFGNLEGRLNPGFKTEVELDYIYEKHIFSEADFEIKQDLKESDYQYEKLSFEDLFN